MRGVPLLVVGNKQDKLSTLVASSTRYRDIVNLVRKHWRCGYVECSARFNCRVVQVEKKFKNKNVNWKKKKTLIEINFQVFRELMKNIQSVEGRSLSPTAAQSQPLRSHQRDNNEKCVLL